MFQFLGESKLKLKKSKRIKKDNKVPIIPEKQPKIKYNIPIFLWFILKIHLLIKSKLKFNIYNL